MSGARSGTAALVVAKAPVPGRVKTRLFPPLSPTEAAAVAEAALADTLDAVARCAADRLVVVLDGEPGPWLPPGFEVVAQRGSGLDERLAAAWRDVGAAGVQIGMDTPQLVPGDLDAALASLDRHDAALGPATDGGWWAIALRRPDPACFLGVPMSEDVTGLAQRQRLADLGLTVAPLPTLRDIDTADDLAAVARDHPHLRTSALAGRHLPPCHLQEGGSVTTLVLRAEDGQLVGDGAARWFDPATASERALLARLPGPVLDVGCGPGRLVAALLELGVPALGVDTAAGAVALARGQGASALARSIFDRLPAEGRWGSALLADGNVGIGGDPVRLLSRLGQVVRPGGTIAVEVDPKAEGVRRRQARVERGGEVGAWFPWAVVGVDALPGLARASGLVHRGTQHVDGRPFGLMARPLGDGA